MSPSYTKLEQSRSGSDIESTAGHEESKSGLIPAIQLERLLWLFVATPHVALEEVVFTGGVEVAADGTMFLNHSGEARRYVGEPSREIDENWDNLENAIDLILDRSEARTKNEKDIDTMREPGEEGILDVFHSLHCVNQLRKVVYVDHYFPKIKDSEFFFIHMSHCVEHLRQAIQCHSDFTPLVYTWDEKEDKGGPVWTSKHTCRNFTKIWEWDKTRAAPALSNKPGAST
ncbi:hypothetical protein BKA65DRAFT_479611 [Rhexocercosporidium sp. MPI-PUGE-AT-0058]|nr:hypothetical protein BKA65DRAFT_479611 [Rhexocercosporidium sp. MPI-PUGE-AT-0058]